MQLAVRWVAFSALLTVVPALRLLGANFPTHVVRGGPVNLTCDYDTGGKRLYLVKWYKDDREFYSHAPGKAGRTFSVPGVNVNVVRSTSRSVLLESVDLATEGHFSCEVTVDQSFDTVLADGWVTVVELPQRGPVISGDYQDSMDEGERVRVNCTAYRSRPAANLTWYINGARSDSGLLRTYESVSDSGDLRTVTLGLDFRLRGAHFAAAGQVTLKCTAEIEGVFYHSADVRIASRTMALRAGRGAGSVQCAPVRLPVLALLAFYLLCLFGG